jgi:hypothetical protein
MGGALGDEAGEDFGDVMDEMIESEIRGEGGETAGEPGPVDEG